MARVLLIVATIIDLGLAALLVAVSGFIMGPGPESMHADRWVVAGWAALVFGCLAAPVIGFIMRAHARPVGGLILAFLPPIVAAIAATLPPPY
jgi:hypothetical protein